MLWRRSLDAVVILPTGADDVVTLGGTSPAVWELLAEWRTVDDLVSVLGAAFLASPEQVRTDLVPVIAELEALGAVETAADSGGIRPG